MVKVDWGRLQTILVCLVLLLVLLAALGWLLSQISYALILFILARVFRRGAAMRCRRYLW